MYNEEKILDILSRENLVVSSTKARVFSMIIDDIVVSVLFFLIFADKIANVSTYEEIVIFVNFNFVFIAVLKIIYQAFFVWMYGATLGKIVMKIRVISVDYIDKPNFQASLIRAVIRIVSELFFYLGFIWALFYPLKQTWHDKVARTAVVNV